jgi:hypothetical protein
MSDYPVKRKSRPARVLEGDVVDVAAPAAKGNKGLSFRYSYAEFTALGNSARLKAGRTRYEDGKLTIESFEGELDPKTYVHAVTDAQRFFAEQTAACLQAWRSLLLPFTKG